MEIVKSILRMDEDQCARRVAQKYLRVVDPDYYEYESEYTLFYINKLFFLWMDHIHFIENFIWLTYLIFNPMKCLCCELITCQCNTLIINTDHAKSKF